VLYGKSSGMTAGSIKGAHAMPDLLDFDNAVFSALTPEQRLMGAILLRALADLPLSRPFFEIDNGTFRLCCEALGMDPDNVRTKIAKKLKTKAKHVWRFSSVFAVGLKIEDPWNAFGGAIPGAGGFS
jgi:hypothetical protein